MGRQANLELRTRVIELRRQGASYEEIAVVAGCAPKAVGYLIRKYAPELGGCRVDPATGRLIKGFAAMDPARRAEIAARGGASVPANKRSFSTNSDLAESAGRKGGQASRGGGRPRAVAPADLTEQAA